jgi:hypothetical protein
VSVRRRLAPLASGLACALTVLLAGPFARADTARCVAAAHEGQRLRDSGKLTSARSAFVGCSTDECPQVVRETCEEWAREIEPRIPDVVLGARDDAGRDLYEVRVSLDGALLTTRLDGRAVPLDPGPHEVLFEAKGFEPVKVFLVTREGEKLRPVVAVFSAAKETNDSGAAPPPATPRADAPRRSSLPLVIGGGSAVVGLAGFAVFGAWGQSERNRLERTCAPTQTCSTEDVRAARTKLIVANVSLLVGVVGAGVVGALLLAPKPASTARNIRAKAPFSVGVAPVPGGAVGSFAYGY